MCMRARAPVHEPGRFRAPRCPRGDEIGISRKLYYVYAIRLGISRIIGSGARARSGNGQVDRVAFGSNKMEFEPGAVLAMQ